MSSSPSRRARRVLSKEQFFRVTPLEEEEAHGAFSDGPITQLIDAPFEDVHIALVPPTISTAMAQDIEGRLTQKLGKPVIVMTNNIKFCKVTAVSRDEVIESMKGAENVAVPQEALEPSVILGPNGLPQQRSSVGGGHGAGPLRVEPVDAETDVADEGEDLAVPDESGSHGEDG